MFIILREKKENLWWKISSKKVQLSVMGFEFYIRKWVAQKKYTSFIKSVYIFFVGFACISFIGFGLLEKELRNICLYFFYKIGLYFLRRICMYFFYRIWIIRKGVAQYLFAFT